MSQPLLDLLVALSAYRVWRLLALDKLLDAPRSAFYERFPPDAKWATYRVSLLAARAGKAVTPGDIERARISKVGVLIDCPWCAGWWLCGLVTLAAWWWYGLALPWLVWPASSTIVGLIGSKLDG